jgi:hypothetical protein
MATTAPQLTQTIRLDRALENTVIQSWDELMPDSTSGLIHLEYQAGNDGSLEFLRIWASTVRGSWKLICEYWIRPLWSHAVGLRFESDYYSEDLARNLEFVIGRETALSKLPDQIGLIQIYPPTEEKRGEADRWTKQFFGHRNPASMESHTAA